MQFYWYCRSSCLGLSVNVLMRILDRMLEPWAHLALSLAKCKPQQKKSPMARHSLLSVRAFGSKPLDEGRPCVGCARMRMFRAYTVLQGTRSFHSMPAALRGVLFVATPLALSSCPLADLARSSPRLPALPSPPAPRRPLRCFRSSPHRRRHGVQPAAVGPPFVLEEQLRVARADCAQPARHRL